MTPDHQGTCLSRACNSHLEKKTAQARLLLPNEPPPSVSSASSGFTTLSWVSPTLTSGIPASRKLSREQTTREASF